MTFARLAFLIITLSFLGFVLGLFPGQESAVEENSLWFGILLFAALSFVVFRARIWADNSQSGGRPMTIVHRTSRTPAQVMRDATIARLQIILVIALIVIIVLEYMGYHDSIVAVLDWMAVKGEKLANALIH